MSLRKLTKEQLEYYLNVPRFYLQRKYLSGLDETSIRFEQCDCTKEEFESYVERAKEIVRKEMLETNERTKKNTEERQKKIERNMNIKASFELSVAFGGTMKDTFTLKELGYDPNLHRNIEQFIDLKHTEWTKEWISSSWKLEE